MAQSLYTRSWDWHFDSFDIKNLQELYRESAEVPLNHLITAIISHTPLQPLSTITPGSKIKYLIWGYYIITTVKQNESTNRLTLMSKKALKFLEQNNREGFQAGFLCYCHILKVVPGLYRRLRAFGSSRESFHRIPFIKIRIKRGVCVRVHTPFSNYLSFLFLLNRYPYFTHSHPLSFVTVILPGTYLPAG